MGQKRRHRGRRSPREVVRLEEGIGGMPDKDQRLETQQRLRQGLQREQLCRHLDHGLPASRTAVCGHWLWKPQETNTPCFKYLFS